MFRFSLVLTVYILLLLSCRKEKYLFRKSGTWEIQSMKLDYLNAAGEVDSSVSDSISGFFMFYNTPTEGSDAWYLSTNGMTVKGREHHSAHFYQAEGGSLILSRSITQAVPERTYSISKEGSKEMTLDYTGPAADLHPSYTGIVREHIVLQRIDF